MTRSYTPPPTPGMASAANVIDRFPGYSFVPASSFQMRANMTARTWLVFITCVCGLLAAISMAYFLAIFILYYVMERWTDAWISAIGWLFLVICLINVAGLFVLHRVSPMGRQAFPQRWRRRHGLAAEFDYIQPYGVATARYAFFVKNGRFGLYDLHAIRVQIPANYDRLEWKLADHTLLATQGGEKFYLDIQGQRLG